MLRSGRSPSLFYRRLARIRVSFFRHFIIIIIIVIITLLTSGSRYYRAVAFDKLDSLLERDLSAATDRSQR